MAGIGFVLRKLLKKDDLTSLTAAYMHAVMSTSGPWLFTVFALACIYFFTQSLAFHGYVSEFRVIILYNFCFSLVFSAPFALVATRCLSDEIYREDLSDGLSILIGSLATSTIASMPFVLGFYGFYTVMDPLVRCAAIANFYLVLFIWMVSVFVSTLRYYKAITLSYLAGMIVAVYGSVSLAEHYEAAGMVNGFNAGLALVLALVSGIIIKEYPQADLKPRLFIDGLRRYWMYGAGGLFFSLGIWVDKWIMWFSPDAMTYPNGMIVYPYYDSAMFVAYLTVIPTMAMFMLRQETDFFEGYVTFYRDLLKGANFTQVRQNHDALMACVYRNGLSLLMMQAFICIIVIMAAPRIFDLLDMNVIQLGMFRFGVMGAMFQILALFLCTVLAYFEHRKGLMGVQLFFCLSNAVLTTVTLLMGFKFYGFGYFISALLTFLLAAVIAERFIYHLPYHTFISTNTSVKE